MKALVIYESMYGNTRDIAQAIANGLSEQMEVDLLEVGTAPANVPADVELLVLGGPTHQFGMSRASSREMAAKEATRGLVSPGIGLREWLSGPPQAADAMVAATFCTVMESPRFLKYMGNAARSYDKRLGRLGITRIARPEIFWVTGSKGPLAEGELERARQWGQNLASRVGAPKPVRQPA